MEIILLPKNSLKIKGKRTSIIVDPSDKLAQQGAVLLLNKSIDEIIAPQDTVVINGPGEYETGGVKMNAMRSAGAIIYSIVVDGVQVLLGKISSYEKIHSKLNEHHIVIAYADVINDASFITSLTSNAVIFYGEHSAGSAGSFGKGNVKQMQKYSTTLDKLPAEVETVILE